MSEVEFLGQHFPRLDDKGRLFLPARFRADLGDAIVLTKGADHCLAIYPHEVFRQRVIQRLNQASLTGRKEVNLRRALLGQADPGTVDRQGRITIPAKLREYAGLDKDCTILGQGSYLELWNTTAYAAIEAASDLTLDDLDDEGVFTL